MFSTRGAQNAKLFAQVPRSVHEIILWPQNDEAGQKWLADALATLAGRTVKVARVPGQYKDLNEWTLAGAGNKELLAALREVETPELSSLKSQSQDDSDFEFEEPERLWPVIDPYAFYGILGRISRLIEPATEADPVAILVQLLAAFGNVVGRNPFFYVESAQHHTNIFACVVGRTSKGRKGTSLNHIKRLFKIIDPDWTKDLASGLSSGEGVIWAVHDPIFQAQRDKKTGEVNEVMIDNGVEDKRLFVGQTEFAQALKVMSRETNILSMVLRDAWDTGDLRTLIKNNPARATNAHVSVVGHITEEELKRELGECELFNGFANRFLWLVAKRSNILPDGGQLPSEFDQLAFELKKIVEEAKKIGQIKRDGEARAHWHAIYPDLSAEGVAMVGAVTSRAEAQVLRLSIIYALSDASAEIRLPHLKAALAFWEYSAASAKYIFGDRLADLNAQKILEALKDQPAGMTRKEIYDEVFHRHINKRALAVAFETLESLKLISKETEQTGGRPLERWFFRT